MECKDKPDLAVGTGAITTWNQRILFYTYITYTCTKGQAFDKLYKEKVHGYCNTHNKPSPVITWKYNQSNKIPKCIRKISHIFLLFHWFFFPNFPLLHSILLEGISSSPE